MKSASTSLIAPTLLLCPLAAARAQQTGRVCTDADYAQAGESA